MLACFLSTTMILLSIPWPGRVAQSVTCLATDACLIADPGVASSIPVRSHTFVEIDHEMISTVILLLPLIHSRRVVVSYKRKYVHELLVNRLFKPVRPAMTIAVDLGRKAAKQTNKLSIPLSCAGAILKNRPVCYGTSRLKNRFCAVI